MKLKAIHIRSAFRFGVICGAQDNHRVKSPLLSAMRPADLSITCQRCLKIAIDKRLRPVVVVCA